MGAGFQCWDASGNLVLDTSDRLPRRVADLTIATGVSGSVTVPGTNAIWYQVVNSSVASAAGGYSPLITISGRVLSWAPNNAYAASLQTATTLTYGLY